MYQFCITWKAREENDGHCFLNYKKTEKPKKFGVKRLWVEKYNRPSQESLGRNI